MLAIFGIILFVCFVIALVADTCSYPKHSIISLCFSIVCILIVGIMLLITFNNALIIK